MCPKHGIQDDDTDSDDSDDEDELDEDEVFVISEADRELLLVSQCCCHARRMRFRNIQEPHC